MLNPHVKGRVEFAFHLIDRIASFDGVKAIVVAGSVARNCADAFSDLELPIFWDGFPADAQRLALIRDLNGNFLFTYDGPSAEDQLLIDGLQVDLWHITVEEEEQTIDAVLHARRLDLGGLNAMDTVGVCIPLYGHELVRRWKASAQVYPDELAQRLIELHLPSFSLKELVLFAQRDNPVAFHGQLSHLLQEIFLVLLALNRRYFPTFKWMFETLEIMSLKPEGIAQRMRQVYCLPCHEAVTVTKTLLEETLDLVAIQFPHLDLALACRRLSYLRSECRFPPSTDGRRG